MILANKIKQLILILLFINENIRLTTTGGRLAICSLSSNYFHFVLWIHLAIVTYTFHVVTVRDGIEYVFLWGTPKMHDVFYLFIYLYFFNSLIRFRVVPIVTLLYYLEIDHFETNAY